MEMWFSEFHTPNVKHSLRVEKHLYSKQSDYQRIDIFETPEFGRVLTLDGNVMLTERDEFIYDEMITHVPMAVHKDAKDILVIGAGDGGVVRELTRYDRVENIDLVEMDPMVVEACRAYLPGNACRMDDRRVQIHFENALKFIRRCETKYDLIIVPPGILSVQDCPGLSYVPAHQKVRLSCAESFPVLHGSEPCADPYGYASRSYPIPPSVIKSIAVCFCHRVNFLVYTKNRLRICTTCLSSQSIFCHCRSTVLSGNTTCYKILQHILPDAFNISVFITWISICFFAFILKRYSCQSLFSNYTFTTLIDRFTSLRITHCGYKGTNL
jgi:hypothetical protein